MSKEKEFKKNVDLWIKDINKRLAKIEKLPKEVEENIGNTNFNYELIHELKDDVENLQQQLNAIQLMQIILLKSELKKVV